MNVLFSKIILYSKRYFWYYKMGSKETHDPRRGDASRVADFVVFFARELVFLGDSLGDGKREREHDDDERRDVAGICACTTNSERDCQRATAASNDDGRSAVHNVPALQGSQVRSKSFDRHRRHRQWRWLNGKEQVEWQREQSRLGKQHADGDIEARVDRWYRRESGSESRWLRHVPAADIVKSGLRQPLLNVLFAHRWWA